MKKYLVLIMLCVFSIFFANAQGEWSQTNLSSKALRMGAVSQGSKVYFAGGSRGVNLLPSKVIDIYDLNSRQWTTSNMSNEREIPAGVSNGSKVFFAGGINFISNNSFADVDIYTCIPVGNKNAQKESQYFLIQPNPAANDVVLKLPNNFLNGFVNLMDIAGKIVYTSKISDTQKLLLDLKEINEGVYIIQIQSNDRVYNQKLIVSK